MRAILALTRRPWLPCRLRLARALNRLVMPSGGYVLSALPEGWVMELDLTDPLQQWLHYLADYEMRERGLLLSALPPGGTLVDVGANVGWYALPAAILLEESGGRVYAFEALPPNLERLRRNLELNGIRNVTVEGVALIDREGTVRISTSEPRSGNATIAPRCAWAQQFEIAGTTFDACAARHGISRVDAVKIDAEGAELQVLRGMTGLLRSSPPPFILCEINPILLRLLGTSPEELLGFLAGHGYQPSVQDANGHLVPFAGARRGHDHENVIFRRS